MPTIVDIPAGKAKLTNKISIGGTEGVGVVETDVTPPKPDEKKAGDETIVELTDDELEQRKRDLEQSMGWTPAPAKPKKKKEEEKPKEAAEDDEDGDKEEEEGDKEEAARKAKEEEDKKKAEADKKAAEAAKPKKADTEPEPGSSRLSDEEMIDATADAVARKLAPKPEKPASATTTPSGIELTPEDQRDIKIIEILEQKGGRYAGMKRKYLDYVQKNYEYQAEWEKAHPDEEFNPDAEEHKAFYAKHEPEIDAADFEEAKDDLKFQERYEKTIRPQMEEIKAREALSKAGPRIMSEVNRSVVNFVESIDPEWAKMFKDERGNPRLNEETRNAFKEATDEATFKVLVDTSRHMEPMIVELEKTTVPELNYRFDTQRNPIHKEIADYVAKGEKVMLTSPDNIRIRDGRTFVTFDQMRDKKAAILESDLSDTMKQKRVESLYERFWTLDPDDVKEMIVKVHAKRAKDRLKEIDDVVEARSKRKNGKQEPTPKENDDETPQAGTPAKKPPTVSAGSDRSTGGKTKTEINKKFSDIATETLFGG